MFGIRPPLAEVMQRLVHIERKIDLLGPGRPAAAEAPVGNPGQAYSGHPDQAYGPYTYAQHGDDLLLLNIFDAIGVAQPSYLDIGAHHPVNISNTALLHQRGSRGVNVDANPNLIEEFRIRRPEDINLNCGVSDSAGEMTFYMVDKWSGRNSFDRSAVERFVREDPRFRITAEIRVPVITVDELIVRHCGGRFPDLLSIDVEGLEGRILRSISYDKWAPKVICAETCRPDHAGGGDDLTRFLAGVGYFPLLRNRGNSFFVQAAYRRVLTGEPERP